MENIKGKVLALQKKFNDLIEKANNNELEYESIFEQINIRDFLPETKIIATIWSIEDIRDKFPEGTPDYILISALHDISGMLQEAAVMVGHDVIADNIEVSL